MRHGLLSACFLILQAGVVSVAYADEPPKGNINLTSPTGGGKQFWTDYFVYGQWRIQQNVFTGHCRLLDDQDFRRAWGSYDACLREFNKQKQKHQLTPARGTVVLTLHGLGRSRQSMAGMGKYLAEQGGYTWINMGYSSTRRSIDEHAVALAAVISNLTEAEEIHFVAHSLGNLVIRRYLTLRAQQPPGSPGPKPGRFVMLGPPNQGAVIAERLKYNELFRLVYGVSGKQLSDNWSEVEQRLATPQFPFGIIAGGRGEGGANNPLLDGDDDFVVTIEETRLAGATDFLIVPALHTFFMDDTTVRESTLRFLQHGYFTSADARQPIPAIAPIR